MDDFFDYLNLKSLNLNKYHTFIFYGVSGAGKSSYIKWLEKNIQNNKKVLVFDEIYKTSQFINTLHLKKNHILLIASHIPLPFPTQLLRKMGIYYCNLNKYPEKIEMHLRTKGVIFSKSVIKKFHQEYKSSFKDLEIILDTDPVKDFDYVFTKFQKYYRIKHIPDYELIKTS